MFQCRENKITNANGVRSKTVFLLSDEQIISYLVTTSESLTGKFKCLIHISIKLLKPNSSNCPYV